MQPHFDFAPDGPFVSNTMAHGANRGYFARFLPEVDSIVTGIQVMPAVAATGDPTTSFGIYEVGAADGELARVAVVSDGKGRVTGTADADVLQIHKYSTAFSPRLAVQGGKVYYGAVRISSDASLELVSARMGREAMMESSHSQVVIGLAKAVYVQGPLKANHNTPATRPNHIYEVPLIGISYQRRIICVGDSVTGNLNSTPVTARYPRSLAGMLGRHAYVMNVGIGANTISDVNARLKSDVLNRQPLDAVVLVGINDIQGNRSAASIITDLQTLYATIAASDTGVNVRPVTILPFGAYIGWSTAREAVRLAVNDWIRTSSGLPYTEAETMGDGHATQPALQASFDDWDGLHISQNGDTELAKLIFQQSFGGQPTPRLASVNG